MPAHQGRALAGTVRKQVSCNDIGEKDFSVCIGGYQSFFYRIHHIILAYIHIEKLMRVEAHQRFSQKADKCMGKECTHEHHQNKDSQVNYQYVTVPCRYMGGEDRGHDKTDDSPVTAFDRVECAPLVP